VVKQRCGSFGMKSRCAGLMFLLQSSMSCARLSNVKLCPKLTHAGDVLHQAMASLPVPFQCPPMAHCFLSVQAKGNKSSGSKVGPATKLLGGKDVLYTGKVLPRLHLKGLSWYLVQYVDHMIDSLSHAKPIQNWIGNLHLFARRLLILCDGCPLFSS
jgi:hypothetical protein